MTVEYSLEYGTGQLDIHQDALTAGQTVVIVDDLLATGGTAMAAAKLVELLGAQVHSFAFLVELGLLEGREHLSRLRRAVADHLRLGGAALPPIAIDTGYVPSYHRPRNASQVLS